MAGQPYLLRLHTYSLKKVRKNLPFQITACSLDGDQRCIIAALQNLEILDDKHIKK